MTKDEPFEYSEWVKRGSMLVRRSALPHSDAESIPSLWKAKYGTPMPLWAAQKVWGEDVKSEVCTCCGGPRWLE